MLTMEEEYVWGAIPTQPKEKTPPSVCQDQAPELAALTVTDPLTMGRGQQVEKVSLREVKVVASRST